MVRESFIPILYLYGETISTLECTFSATSAGTTKLTLISSARFSVSILPKSFWRKQERHPLSLPNNKEDSPAPFKLKQSITSNTTLLTLPIVIID
jgi:hypothetical protein